MLDSILRNSEFAFIMKNESVKTALRTLSVFEAFAERKAPLSLTDLARHVESPVSSCHGLLRTLKATGYVYLLNDRRRYYPTRRLFNLARQISAHDQIVEKLVPLMETLRERTEETIILAIRQDDEILYLHILEGPQTIRYAAYPGDRKPLHSSALGKAFLGEQSDQALAEFLEGRELAKITEATITSPDRLIADIQRARRRGYFMTRNENGPEIGGIARVFRVDLEPVGLCVAGPSRRIAASADAIGGALAEIVAAAAALPSARPA